MAKRKPLPLFDMSCLGPRKIDFPKNDPDKVEIFLKYNIQENTHSVYEVLLTVNAYAIPRVRGKYYFVSPSQINKALIHSIPSHSGIKIEMVEPLLIRKDGEQKLQFVLVDKAIISKPNKMERTRSKINRQGDVKLVLTDAYKNIVSKEDTIAALFKDESDFSVAQWVISRATGVYENGEGIHLKYYVVVNDLLVPSSGRFIEITSDYKKGNVSVQRYSKKITFP